MHLKERERESMGLGRGRQRQRIPCRLPTEHGGARGRAQSQDPETITRAEIRGWPFNRRSHPGALRAGFGTETRFLVVEAVWGDWLEDGNG